MKKAIALCLVVMMLLSALPVFASKTAEQAFLTESIKGEVIIPFSEAEAEGEYKPSTVVKGYDGNAHYWGSAPVTYKLDNIKKGRYELFFWVCPHPVCMEKVEFEVFHAGETTKTFVYQKLDEGEEQAPGWVSLGVFEFSGDGTEYVKMPKAGGTTRHSALKYASTDKPVTGNTAPAEKEEERVSSEGVPVIGEKKPHETSKLIDISVAPAGSCSWNGEWTFSGKVAGPMKDYPSSLWIAGVGEEAYVTYNPNIEAVGDVNIFVYLLWWHENQNPKAHYEIHHNGKVDTVELDPTTLTESAWVYLGTFDFAGKPEEEFVKLVCQRDENIMGNTRASTMMFEIVNSANGGIWQTRYVTPHQTVQMVVQSAKLAALDKFADMKEHWANYDVEYMANEGLVSGVSDTEFDPEAQITRAEYVTILDRAMQYELVSGASYDDVAQDAWYATYVATAKENGLLNGLPTDDGFKPEQPITREEMALFTYNAIKATKKNDAWVATMQDSWASFTDTDEVSDWAKEALQYLIKTEIIKGTSDTTVSAKENATRAQGAVILKRFMQLFVWAGPPTDQEWELMFNDEFQGEEMDWSVWRSDSSAPGHILSSRWPENVEVHDGAVHLVIRKEEREGKEWTAGSVWVRPEVFAQTYGYWEARYKVAAAPGINNSFWTYVSHAHNIHKLPDSKMYFELDINEGHYPNKVNMTYHTSVSGESKSYSETYTSPYDLSVDYHTYALEWTPEELRYYHDGELKSVQPNLNAHQLQFPYLSSAVLNWAGVAPDSADGTAQIVDYVRIWQKKENVDKPELNFKGEPLVGVGPAEQGVGTGSSSAATPGITGNAVTIAEQEIDNATYPGEIIIEPVLEGTWESSTAIQNYNDGPHMWSKEAGATSTYSLQDVKKGKYKIYMWRLPHKYNVAQMDMILKQNGEETLAGSVALRLGETEKAESGWVLLGEHELTGDKDACIYYVCPGNNCRASAIKLVPVQ